LLDVVLHSLNGLACTVQAKWESHECDRQEDPGVAGIERSLHEMSRRLQYVGGPPAAIHRHNSGGGTGWWGLASRANVIDRQAIKCTNRTRESNWDAGKGRGTRNELQG